MGVEERNGSKGKHSRRSEEIAFSEMKGANIGGVHTRWGRSNVFEYWSQCDSIFFTTTYFKTESYLKLQKLRFSILRWLLFYPVNKQKTGWSLSFFIYSSWRIQLCNIFITFLDDTYLISSEITFGDKSGN